MRRLELFFGYCATIAISTAVGFGLFYDSKKPSELSAPILFTVLLAIAGITFFTVLLRHSRNGVRPSSANQCPEATQTSSSGVVPDSSALLNGLSRIEDRLAKLESVKSTPAPQQSPAMEELLELQTKAYLEIKSALKDLQNRPTANPNTSVAPAEDKLGELSGALSEAMKEISRRDGTIDTLTANVTRTNIQRVLARVTQILEVARALQARVADGKSSAAESFEFLVDDMDAALADQGVEHLDIAAGMRVTELPAGSFAAISVIDAPEESLRGTVKEVRSRSYFIPEEGKKPRYIAPAKVILYRA